MNPNLLLNDLIKGSFSQKFSSALLMLGTKKLCCKEDMAKLRPAKFFLRPLKLLVIGKFMLKRGMSARLSEWLLAADYILSGGNEKE